MLLRLYHPLLFRDLAAANAAVRNNALQLLIDAFPLQDTGAPAEVCELPTSSCHSNAVYSVLSATMLYSHDHSSLWGASLTVVYVPSACMRALFKNLLRTHVLGALPKDIRCMSHFLPLYSQFLQ